MKRIEFWFDPVSPFAYLAFERLPEAERDATLSELSLHEWMEKEIGVGPARICQIKKSAHDRLRKALAG